VTLGTTHVFDLPDRLAAKADPALVAEDERHFALLSESLEQSVRDLTDRLDAARRAPGGTGQEAMDRDLEIHRLTARLRTLRRYRLDLCLGRMVVAGAAEPVYVGRIGLADNAGGRLLVDWRSPAAEPFFAATLARPLGLVSRRRYRWTAGLVTDYWDEVLVPDLAAGHVAPDEDSAFIAGLGGARTDRMRDVLGTLQADQDAIIRASSRGPLVVEGGPGTGKTVVALHRSAYLLYADPRLGAGRGGILVVGPHQPYLAYVADVLPSLGEEGVRTCTLRDLVPEGAEAVPEADPRVARLKSTTGLVEAIEPAVALYEEPPADDLLVRTPWSEVLLTAADWAEAFAAPDPGTPHNDARDQVWDALVDILVDRHDAEVPGRDLRRSFAANRDLVDVFGGAWPRLDPADLVGDLWTVPAYLRRCAPWLDGDEVRLLQRADPRAWTLADLPLLDAARHRLGDPEVSRLRRRRETAAEAEREQMNRVVDLLIASDDSEMHVMSMLRGEDLQGALVDESALPGASGDDLRADSLSGPFAHVVVDEAQELTDAEWQMLLRRCPSRSLTVVGDRAQARHGFPESWHERLARAGLGVVRLAGLSINYRTPEEVMAAAEPVIRAVVPDARVPVSVRSSGRPVRHGSVADLDGVLSTWLAEHDEGLACVIGSPEARDHSEVGGDSRVRRLTPETAKGLEFDLVVLVEVGGQPGGEPSGAGIEAAVDRYVAMTRATQQLVVLT
jgi:hypothetical protein